MDRALVWLSWMLVIGQLRRQLDQLPAPGVQATPARVLAAGLSLHDAASTLAAVVAVAADEVHAEAGRIRGLESRAEALITARRAWAVRPTAHAQVREAVRLLPFAWREAVMDWVRRPYVGGSLSSRRVSEDPALLDLVSRLARLELDSAEALERVRRLEEALRKPPLPAFAAAREAALEQVPAATDELRQLAARASHELRARYRHLRQVSRYRENLEYVVARIDPGNSDPQRRQARHRPPPLPDVQPDTLRALTRRVLPLGMRSKVMDWVLP